MRRSRYPYRARDQGRQLSYFRLVLFRQPFWFGSFVLSFNEHTRGLTAPTALLKHLADANTLGSSALRFRFTHHAATNHNVLRLATGRGKPADFEFEVGKPFAQFKVLSFSALGTCRQVCVVAPPVQTDLLGFIDRANEQTDLQRQ